MIVESPEKESPSPYPLCMDCRRHDSNLIGGVVCKECHLRSAPEDVPNEETDCPTYIAEFVEYHPV